MKSQTWDIRRLVPGLLVCATLPHGTPFAQEWHQQGQIEFGAGYIFEDEYRFGRYNGMTDDGAIAVTDADVQRRRQDGAYQYLEADRLGLDSRYLELGGGIQGKYGVQFDYNQIPNNMFDTARTPFRGVGSDRLTLPAGWDDGATTGEMAALDASLRSFDIETERKLGMISCLGGERSEQTDANQPRPAHKGRS